MPRLFSPRTGRPAQIAQHSGYRRFPAADTLPVTDSRAGLTRYREALKVAITDLEMTDSEIEDQGSFSLHLIPKPCGQVGGIPNSIILALDSHGGRRSTSFSGRRCSLTDGRRGY